MHIKNLISPVQAWLLSRGQCVGCAKNLNEAKTKKWDDQHMQVNCECGRVYIYHPKSKHYRRAVMSEIK